jgi:hypothetical protein
MLRRIAPALGLLLLAPVCAEYLSGYDDSTGNVAALLEGLFLFAPLYGGAALIIREVTRRTGRGWPAMLLLGLAFGVLQAGLIDHSMFNPSYRDIEYWDESYAPTFVPALGVSVNHLLTFALGHMIWSISAPIALVEALVPARRKTPWLGKLALSVVVVAFVLAAWVVIEWHLQTEAFLPSIGQLIGAAVAVIGLTIAAFALPHRPRSHSDRPAATPWLVGAVTFATLIAPNAIEIAVPTSQLTATWPGIVLNLLLLATLAIIVARWSARPGWGPTHSLAIAGGALLTSVVTAFATQPIGDVNASVKLAHNLAAVLLVLALLALAAYRLRTVRDHGTRDQIAH